MRNIQNRQLYQELINPANIPPFPQHATRVMQILQVPTCSINDVHDSLVQDPALVALAMKVANSPLFPTQKEIASIGLALSFLGTRRLKSILYTYFFRFLLESGKGQFHRQREFWEHALSVGLFAQILGIQLDHPDDSECFTAGLLHDLGKFVMWYQSASRYRDVEDLAAAEGIPAVEAERRLLGLDHQDVGRGICRRWNFPPSLVDAIALHHETDTFAEHPELVRVVLVGNLLAHSLEDSATAADQGKQAEEYMKEMGLGDRVRSGIRQLYREKYQFLSKAL